MVYSQLLLLILIFFPSTMPGSFMTRDTTSHGGYHYIIKKSCLEKKIREEDPLSFGRVITHNNYTAKCRHHHYIKNSYGLLTGFLRKCNTFLWVFYKTMHLILQTYMTQCPLCSPPHDIFEEESCHVINRQLCFLFVSSFFFFSFI